MTTCKKEVCFAKIIQELFLIHLCIFAVSFAEETNCIETLVSTPSCVVTKQLPLNKDGELNYGAMPSIGNGYIATVIMSDEIHVSGVFNGKANVEPADSDFELKKSVKGYYNHTHRARIPSPISANFTTNIPDKSEESRSYVLDMQRAVFVQSVQGFVHGMSYTVQQRSYAHQVLKNIIVTELIIESSIPLNISLSTNMGAESEDFDIISTTSEEFDDVDVTILHARTRESETETSKKVEIAMVYSVVPTWLVMQPNSTRTFITAMATNLEFDNAVEGAIEYYGVALSEQGDLFEPHVKAWDQIWRTSNITIDNDLFLAQIVYSSFYNILLSVRSDWEYGLSPGSLSMGYEYLGHSFWDQETWMFPPVLMFHPDCGKSLLNYRFERLQAAQSIAKKYKLSGAMFPWESAFSGFEVCPQEVYGRNEIHITGDIAFAVNQYFLATNDFYWMETKGFHILYQSALFWQSRVTYNQSQGYYVINDVMPPDEYHYPVNNSVYTNVIAQTNLRLAVNYGKLLNISVPEEWAVIADQMYIPFDHNLHYHPEYEGFDITDPSFRVKQADTILINFPLMYTMSEEVKRNDLKFYSNTDPNGPAMTHSMFSIGWNEIGEYENANIAFEKNYDNIQHPFLVWSEVKGGEGASNFITGAGGFLQSVVFGYGGLRLTDDGLLFNMNVLPNDKSYCLNGIKYLGNILQFCRHGDKCFVKALDHFKTYINVKVTSPEQCHGIISQIY